MRPKPYPSAEVLRDLLEYDPETGALIWKPREARHFPGIKRPELRAKQFNGRYAGKPAASPKESHLTVCIMYKTYYVHRVAWIIHYGVTPSDLLDHINGDGTDNRISNLRQVDPVGNSRNKKLSNRSKSGHHGVYFTKAGRWKATMMLRTGKTRSMVVMGTFDTKAEAVAARQAAERELGFHPNHGRQKDVAHG